VNPRRAQDGFNFANEKGRSALDLTHKLALTFVYDLPNISTSNGFLKALAHGWEWNGSYLVESGQPVTALSGSDANANGDPAGDRAILNPGAVAGPEPALKPFATPALVVPSPSLTRTRMVCGSASHLVFRVTQTSLVMSRSIQLHALSRQKSAPFRQSVEIRSARQASTSGYERVQTTKINERFSLQFRVATYDTFNHSHFSIGLRPITAASIKILTPTL